MHQTRPGPLARGLDRIERALDRAFGPEWNPLAQLGPLGWLLFWTVAVTGIYLFAFFDTGLTETYASIEWMGRAGWWHAGLARSLHRYASDMMVVVMFAHLFREWVLGRFRGARWFSWFTGVPLVWFVYMSGITGFWLVWDRLAQYVATTTTELLDSLGIFAEPIARNFLSPAHLSDRFFTLMVFLHIAIPLLLLLLMWIHLQRITAARTRPPRGLAVLTLGSLVAVSLVAPAPLNGAADLARVPQSVGLDWFFLSAYPLIERLAPPLIWTGALVATVALASLPWLPPRPAREAPAEIFLDHCNGCERCAEDCPYNAIRMVPRSDGAPFALEAAVLADRCVACGICMGACPSSSPFRRSGGLVTGIDLPDLSLAELKARVIRAAEGAAKQEAAGQETAGQGTAGPARLMTLACAHGAGHAEAPGRVVMPCVAMAPPSLFDFILSRGLADGVVIAGCAERACYNRLGREWTDLRIARARDPMLRQRVPRERLLTVWAGPSEAARLARETGRFAERLAGLAALAQVRPLSAEERAEAEAVAAATAGPEALAGALTGALTGEAQ
ncbi:cytochrome b N-terminal domain-containing protein [Albidovulum sp.]